MAADRVPFTATVKYDRILLHMSDLHLDATRVEEYTQVIGAMLAMIKSFPFADKLVIVITGDLFDHKTNYGPAELSLYRLLVDGLAQVAPTVIIPGNHDGNLNAVDQPDLITPLVELAGNSNVHYFRASGFYEVHGVPFYHLSVFGTETQRDITDLILGDPNRAGRTVLLYHGPFEGPRCKITRRDAACWFIGCLGDQHEQQYITTNVAYAGSLIQRNVAESMRKGFLVWHLQEHYSAFMKVPNRHGMLKLDLTGKTQEECVKIINATELPSVLTKMNVICDGANECTIKEAVRQRTQAAPSRIQHPVRCIEPTVDVLDALKELLAHGGMGADDVAYVLNRQKVIMGDEPAPTMQRWTVTRLAWDNLLRYGPNNVLDFTTLKGLSGIIAANEKGKTSVVDILVYALYGEYMRGKRENYMRAGCTTSHVKVDFTVGEGDHATRYYIERFDDTSKTTRIGFYEERDGNWVNITAKTVAICYQEVAKRIGSLNDFLATGLYYEARHDICGSSKADRMRLLPSLFGVRNNEATIKVLKADLSGFKEQLNGLRRPRGDTLTDPSVELAESESAMSASSKRTQELTGRMMYLCAQIGPQRAQVDIAKDLKHSEDLLFAAERELRQLAPKVNLAAVCVEPVSCTPVEIDLAKMELPMSVRQLATCIQCASSKISVLPKDPVAVLRARENLLMKQVTECTENLQARKEQPDDIEHKQWAAALPLQFAQGCQSCCATRDKLGIREARIWQEQGAVQRVDASVSIETYTLRLQAKQAELESVKLQLVTAKQREQLEADLAELKKQHADACRIEQAKDKVGKFAQYTAWKMLTTYRVQQEQVEQHKRRVELCKEEEKAARSVQGYIEELRAVKESLKEAKKELDDLTAKHTACLARHQVYQEETTIRTEWQTHEPRLRAEIARIKQHITCLGSAGLKTIVIKKNISAVIQATNDLLATCSFTVEAQIDDSGLNLLLRKGKLLQPVAMGSGFQKFAVSLALRLALCAVLPQTADFIIYDEGFGVADKPNIAKIQDLFAEVKSRYRFMFIVSHVEALQAAIECPLWIAEQADACGVHSVLTTDAVAAGVPVLHVSADEPKKVEGAPKGRPEELGWNPKTHMKCACGAILKKNSYNGHLATKAHQTRMGCGDQSRLDRG